MRDAHWDYAYTITGYGVQGASKPYVIDYELSYRKNLTHQRSFYIAISRAEQHVMIYTDNKVKLLDRLQNNTGQKYSAHDVIEEVNWSNPSGAALKEKMALLNERTERTLLQESRKLKRITNFLSKEEVRHVEINNPSRL